MLAFQKSEFNSINIDEIISTTKACKQKGWAFVQLCAIVRESSCELLYTFDDEENKETSLHGFLVDVADGQHVPSITEIYPAAFVFENETHDLFGVEIDGISVDFEGNLYTVAVAYPMNPRAAISHGDNNEKGDK